VKAWHFLKSDKTLRYDEKTKVELGVTLKCDPSKIKLCVFGYHASKRPIDALSYLQWTDAIICLVELGGKIVEGDDKVVASERKVIAWCNADTILHEFACRCAERVLPLYEKRYPNDPRPRKAIEAKRLFLKGGISKEELNEALRDAAAYATDAAAAYAADAAAYAAAAYAADAAAYAAAAARAAAYAAADAAADAAAYAAAAARADAYAAADAAAYAAAAARADAYTAARTCQNEILESMFLEALKLTKEDLI
jgi:hypothetical protein